MGANWDMEPVLRELAREKSRGLAGPPPLLALPNNCLAVSLQERKSRKRVEF